MTLAFTVESLCAELYRRPRWQFRMTREVPLRIRLCNVIIPLVLQKMDPFGGRKRTKAGRFCMPGVSYSWMVKQPQRQARICPILYHSSTDFFCARDSFSSFVIYKAECLSPARQSLQETVHLVATSGKDVRLSVKKILVHACANLDVDRYNYNSRVSTTAGQAECDRRRSGSQHAYVVEWCSSSSGRTVNTYQ